MLAVLCTSIAACGGSSHTMSPTGRHAAAPAATRVANCPVTTPNGRTPPGEQPSPEDNGNGALWTVLPRDGTIVARRLFVLRDGSMRIKFPWWGSRSAGTSLRISASSLDTRGRLPRSEVAPGLTRAPRFWASAVIFPAEGCWRVTGIAGRARLTFVVLVVKARPA
jgi:hypothetical protein